MEKWILSSKHTFYTLTQKQFLWGIYCIENIYTCIMKVKIKTFNEKVTFLSRRRVSKTSYFR